MDLGNALENRRDNRLRGMNENSDILESTFDYNGIKEEDKEDLQNFEITAQSKRNEVAKNIIELGGILFEARLILASYDKTEGKFMAWYSSIGLNKDEVSVSLKRHSIYLEYPEMKNVIGELPIRTIKYLTSGTLEKEPELKKDVIEKALKKELKTSKDISNYISSHSANRLSEDKTPERRIKLNLAVNRIESRKADIVALLNTRDINTEDQKWDFAKSIIDLIVKEIKK